ncbi:Protein CBG20118 [Caenorhabditis briggsae]|uniref:Protein CBG20118 n=1 Tax=Caenorhabditis briggsae TaxID=6238 RepID=A8XX46_CAEBR|nr:Protein CBG20118 [Caenorhabditis briggsae]CAP37215.2 Protein CBG20118 [Caenorhabditis briggsae]
MSGWLRNIQGQLSDLANEVLNEASEVLTEAREEVPDPDGEIIVAKKKCAEAEKQLAIEMAKVESLSSEKEHLEQQLYDAHVEMDAIGSKLNGMVKQRDEEIKKLKNQMEHIEESGWHETTPTSFPSATETSQITELRQQIAHWKAKAENGENSGIPDKNQEEMVRISEMERKIEALRQQKEHEIQSIVESHAESMVEMREMYEEKISNMQRSLESKLEGLQEQNKELADAYTELNTEFEQFKQQNNVVVNANSDLNRRIDSLKANLIEYEERYELCKKENAETVAQLERLSNDFARLRTGVANVSQRRDDCDLMVNEEVEKLRNALDESRSERERLRDDVQRFQVAVGEIDVELEKLRAANRQLLEENNALTENLTRYDETMKSIISSSEEDIGKFREQFHEIQENHKKQREAMNAENDALREETEAIKRQRDILMEESTLLKDVNEKLKTKTSAEEEKNRLLQEKSDLLEQCLSKERAERAAYNEKSEEAKRETEAKILNSDCDGNLENENSVLKLQLKEALDANAEKTDECEKLIIENRSLEREVDLRQNCVDEMIAQTNTLQMQQESMSTQNKTLQTQILAHERSILEERLAEEQERSDELAKKTKRLEEVIVGGDSSGKDGDDENDDEQSRGSEAKSEELVKFKRYVAELQTKLSETENELKLIKEQKAAENTEAAEIRENLERNLFEAEKVDKELLDGIEARVKDMEGELKQRVDQVDQLKAEKAQLQKSIAEMSEKLEKADEKERLQEHLQKPAESTPEDTTTIEELRGAVSSLQKENEQLKETLQNPPTTSPEDTTRIEELRAAVSSLQKENEQLKETLQTLQTTSPEDTTTIEELRGAVLALQQENEHLKGVAKTQYEENVKYYEQFQAMAQHNQEIQDQLNRNNEQNEKRAKELARLREHLMIVEENSTREAVEAEHRETELRERVKVLEAKGHQVEEGASESNQQYQVQIASLTAQLESSQKTTNDWKRRFDSEQKSREQTQEALASLQNVVRELSIDHERDSATASHRNLELQTTISNLTEEIAQIREEMDRQSIGRQAAEEESERRQLQLESKQKIIEDLENQIEELRSPKKPTDSYRIDDSTLRQLFLSYFSSESSKKADIALLLANILEYPPDEMDKFKSAVRQSVGQQQQSSFWGLSARNSPSPSPGGSIADQFIRFLEIESESSRTAPHLPLRTQNEPAPRMSMDAPTTATQRSKNPQNQATSSSSSSAAALDSLLR